MRTTTALLDAQPGIRHGFFGRQGGVSRPPYDTLNMALRTGDRREDILANRKIVAQAMGAAHLILPRQVHGTTTVRVTTPWPPDDAPEADALVTTEPNLLIGITTADCAPILLCDASAGVVAAAHAGWKGALHGIVDSVVAAMTQAGADPARIAAAIGPASNAAPTRSARSSKRASSKKTRRPNRSSPPAATAARTSTWNPTSACA